MNKTLKRLTFLLNAYAVIIVLTACGGKQSADTTPADVSEDKEAKAMLQGIWLEEESEDVSFRAKGDTIFYPDSTSQPAYFRIVDDSLELGTSKVRYAIVRQTAYTFWFKNQSGDEIHLVKSDDIDHEDEFTNSRPTIMVYTQVVKRDSVVFYNGERYHWYVAINPTKYKVSKRSYNDDGMEVENVYYDNIIHVSLYNGARQLFSRDFRKQMYEKQVPAQFLAQAVLCGMDYIKADADGFHFQSTLCIPDDANCCVVDNVITTGGQLNTKIEKLEKE